MSEEKEALSVLEAGELQSVADLKAGIRDRRFRAKLRVVAGQNGIDADQAWTYLSQILIGAVDTTQDKQALAAGLGIDWEGLTEFMVAMAPIIMEMMAACGV